LTEDHIRRITRGELGCISGVTYAPIARERGPSAPQFWGFVSIYAYTFVAELLNFTCGEGLVLYGQPRPIQRGGVQTLPNFGVLFTYAYTLCRRTTNFDVVTHVAEGRVYWDQPHLPSHSQESGALLNLWGSAVFMPNIL